jgi:hypothetical protein
MTATFRDRRSRVDKINILKSLQNVETLTTLKKKLLQFLNVFQQICI